MPCNAEYLEPTRREQELRRAAVLLVYVWKVKRKPVEDWAVTEASNLYASDERSVTQLCAELKAMTDKQRDDIVYNAKERLARDLADWWEDHQRADAEREEKERAEADNAVQRESALAKLTPAERKALGVKTDKEK